jgi:nicotinate-nucleotide adenylyltransferase
MWSSGAISRPFRARAPVDFRPGLVLQPGMRVGLYGGSFNPVHSGHLHVAQTALTRLGLDRVIWLVSPQNPLKSRGETAALSRRLADARRLAGGPRMVVSDIEARLRARYTIDTLRRLQKRYPGVHFVWIMGADSLAGLHRWRSWQEILRRLPMAVVDRPGTSLPARLSIAAQRFSSARRPEREARRLADLAPPAWVFLTAPHDPSSSTALRRAMRAPLDFPDGRSGMC